MIDEIFRFYGYGGICSNSSERLQQQIDDDYDDGSFELNGAVGGGSAACVRVSPRIIIIAIGGTHSFSFPSYPCPPPSV
jgi:hypothetical protein